MNLTEQLTAPLEIHKFEDYYSGTTVLKSQYNQIVYLAEGNGIYTKDTLEISLTKGCAFIIGNGNYYKLSLNSDAILYVARISDETKLILKDIISQSKGKVVSPFRAKSLMYPVINCTTSDSHLLNAYFKLLLQLQKNSIQNNRLMYYQLVSIITIIERNIPMVPGIADKGLPVTTLQPILKHIHKNIRTPELLGVTFIAQKFNLSENTLGLWFKNELKTTVKRYITQCKMKAIENTINNEKITLSQIALEFGFSDESHFHRSFKNFFGVSPSIFKKNRIKM